MFVPISPWVEEIDHEEDGIVERNHRHQFDVRDRVVSAESLERQVPHSSLPVRASTASTLQRRSVVGIKGQRSIFVRVELVKEIGSKLSVSDSRKS